MDLARRRDVPVTERAIFPDELARASEVFLTGTAVEVNPVRQIDQHQYTVGPITRQLMKDYSELVRS
jgi:branched-chain amino acid aminotransferase